MPRPATRASGEGSSRARPDPTRTFTRTRSSSPARADEFLGGRAIFRRRSARSRSPTQSCEARRRTGESTPDSASRTLEIGRQHQRGARSRTIALRRAAAELCLGRHCCSGSASDGPTRRGRVRDRSKPRGFCIAWRMQKFGGGNENAAARPLQRRPRGCPALPQIPGRAMLDRPGPATALFVRSSQVKASRREQSRELGPRQKPYLRSRTRARIPSPLPSCWRVGGKRPSPHRLLLRLRRGHVRPARAERGLSPWLRPQLPPAAAPHSR
jgi:hypothetical protein